MTRILRSLALGLFLAVGALAADAVVTAAPAHAAGDVKKGKKVFAKCKACHRTVAGKKGVGPNLNGLFGRTAGTLAKFKYSKDMKAAGAKGLVWTEETLFTYLQNPKPFVGSFIGKKKAKTRMVFKGLKKAKDRENLIAYLKEATK
ncbi:MAG: c-type cytochrome [Defluviicoccus sp.]|nr:c-type cytochrome [Defluviicoccus sp.]MDE0386910.1 c-type cytochrome [Defluviicoccus sp.]